MIRYIKEIVVAVLLCAALMVLLSMNSTRFSGVSGQTLRPARGGPIHGYVVANLATNLRPSFLQVRLVTVPDIDVYAKNTKTGAVSARVLTNPQGYFRTELLAPGSYQICAEGVGYVPSCDQKVVEVRNSIEVLGHPVEIQPTPRFISGTIRLADRSTPCFWYRPAFDTNRTLTAKVALLDHGGNVVAGPVFGNILGQYVLPISQSSGVFKLQATCEGAVSTDDVQISDTVQRDVVIRNSTPQITSIDLKKGSIGVRRADPGDVLRATVNVLDLDGDSLHYQWTDDSGRVLNLPDAPSIDWPLMSSPAVNNLHVQVSDGKGGFAVSRRTMIAGPNEIRFSGRVINRHTGAPIDRAEVVVNNVRTETDAAGNFLVGVPDAPRFVLNANKTQFALTSRIYYARNSNLEIPLDPTQQMTVDAEKVCNIVFQPDDCEKRCKKRGNFTIKLEPDMLVDASGHPYNGTVTFEGLQYDISLPNPIPGDQGAVYQGKTVRLSTFGAFYLQPRDASGQPLKLAPNKKMAVSMPIQSELLPKAPAQIPFFSYDETTGLWTDHGKLTRVGSQYVGEITHFSSFNADTVFGGSACVKVILDPPTITRPVLLDATYVEPSSGLFYHNGTQADDSIVGIIRMTPEVNFTLNVRDLSNNLIKSVTLNSGRALDPAQFPDGIPDADYNACNGPVTIYNGNIPTGPPYLVSVPYSGSQFGPFRDNSAAYRTATDANTGGSRATFTGWKNENGFPNSDEAQAIYFNNGDLKFGRNMHCRIKNVSTGTIACYVSNYGDVGTDDAPTALADARNVAITPVATVCMEYDPSAGLEGVQFWAYNGAGDYIQKAALDGQGAKPLPDLCLACHGGSYNGVAGTKARNAAFLPFDLESFLYDTQGNPNPASMNPALATVQEQFRRLNDIVLQTHPDDATGNTTHRPMQQLVNLWYSNPVQNAGSQFVFGLNEASLLGTFTGHEPLYNDVVKPVCRTCHVTRSAGQDWTSFAQMDAYLSIQSMACGGGSPLLHQTYNFAMPHAEVPFKKFWQNSLSSTLSSELSIPCPNQ